MNIYVIDDDADFRASLSSFLKAYGFPVQVFENADVFLSVAEDLSPGCLLLDLRMPGMDGLALQSALGELRSPHQIILQSGFGEIPEAVCAIRAGAIDFLAKPYQPELLLRALARAEEQLVQATEHEGARVVLDRLSDRERAILFASTGGKASKQVAHELQLSIRTVEKYRSKIMHKLGVQNFAGALLVAADHKT